MKRLPEFAGYKSVRFPGTEPPRKQRISPRRLNLPPSFASDWKNIGSKRSEMLMLDLPLWKRQNQRIYHSTTPVEVH